MLSAGKRREDKIGGFISEDVVALDYLLLRLAVCTPANLTFILCAPGLVLMEYVNINSKVAKGIRTKKMITDATERFKPAEPTDDMMRTRHDEPSQNCFTILARCWKVVCPSMYICSML
jgi:hypothetical protein